MKNSHNDNGMILTEEQEKRLAENGYFKYQGFHFKPAGKFTEKDGDFFDITKRLKRDAELGMMEAGYYGKQKHPYSHKAFYEASPVKDADIFICLENQKVYVPCEHELQQYLGEPERKKERRR